LGFKSVERKKKVLGLKNIGKIMCLAEIVKCKIGNYINGSITVEPVQPVEP
jgi:hypothetical protein